jgi:DNA-binding transcriptional MerR regulator
LQHFGTADVARLTDIPAPSIRSMVRARYVTPSKGARGALQFSFQDVLLLRTARTLRASRLSPNRIGAALRAVRNQLPETMPASAVRITASGNRIVVHEAGNRRDVHSGQLLLAFEVRVADSSVEIVNTLPAQPIEPPPQDCEQLFASALALEDTDVDAAVDAYQSCVAAHAHRGAVANLGRLLHLRGRLSDAVALYLGAEDPDADILYNLGVALEDMDDLQGAITAYSRVIAQDDQHADAHHNIARLYQQTGERRLALRHWNAYRRIARS